MGEDLMTITFPPVVGRDGIFFARIDAGGLTWDWVSRPDHQPSSCQLCLSQFDRLSPKAMEGVSDRSGEPARRCKRLTLV